MSSLALLSLFATLTNAHGQQLAIDGACPGPIDLSITDATPGGTVVIISGNGPGTTVMGAGSPCPQTELGVSGNVRRRTDVVADAAGEVQLSPSPGAGACGLWLQALDLSTCTVTEPVPLDGVPGCTHPGALDFDAGATVDDGSCTFATSCLEHQQQHGGVFDGVYTIDPRGSGDPVDVVCDQTRNGGGWTLAVNIVGTSDAHGDDASAFGDLTDPSEVAKLSDEEINALTTTGYWYFECGQTKDAFVTNDAGVWTSDRSNPYDWSLDDDLDTVFECSANRDGYVFSDFNSFGACWADHTNYVARFGLAEGGGCYIEGPGWDLDGALWVK